MNTTFFKVQVPSNLPESLIATIMRKHHCILIEPIFGNGLKPNTWRVQAANNLPLTLDSFLQKLNLDPMIQLAWLD